MPAAIYYTMSQYTFLVFFPLSLIYLFVFLFFIFIFLAAAAAVVG